MVRVGVVLSVLAAIAWIGLSLAARQSEDGVVLVMFLLPLVFLTVLGVIWGTILLLSEIRLYLDASKRSRPDNRSLKCPY
jgi:predicted membrane channel-forming protein YqfA (hemolysin III family)